ncbi:hypothetical protein OVY01_11395 [Robbsia sp. Bb-Pol-6]|uniref:Uncharacterized protein n=1 Tax=Robbsia betulipollinis TaxID=2981849 RepID=A0ABT3ZND2_9BURK|nr:hypothetical protein [Robbsia betulipollinis]MCY0387827.1 hypothetical protein [Robbsia betulipollinis]
MPRPRDPTRPVMFIVVVAVLFVFGTLLYKALSGKAAYQAEQEAQARAWERTHPDVVPAAPLSASSVRP